MRERAEDRARADLRNYGHIVDRKRALRELHPPLKIVLAEMTDPAREAEIAEYARLKRRRDRAARDRARKQTPSPSSLGRAA